MTGAGSEVEAGSRTESKDTPSPTELAEAAVLGAMLWSTSIARKVVDQLDAVDFERHAHSIVFEAISALIDAGEHVDIITATTMLSDSGLLDAVGGAAAMFDLVTIEVVPVPQAWRSYARIVREAADRRRRIAELRRELAALEVAS